MTEKIRFDRRYATKAGTMTVFGLGQEDMLIELNEREISIPHDRIPSAQDPSKLISRYSVSGATYTDTEETITDDDKREIVKNIEIYEKPDEYEIICNFKS